MTRNQDAAPPRAVHAPRFTLHAPRSILSAVALSLLLGFGSATAATPYQPIVERNVFGLKPPPPPVDPTEALKPQPSKITLTGIMTIFGKKQALMKTPPSPAPPPKPGQPPEPPKEHSYLLAEGQREDDITVLQIDTVAKTVKVDNAGRIETLCFLTNAPSAAAGGGLAAPSPTGMQPAAIQRSIPRPLRIPTPGTSSTAIPNSNSSSPMDSSLATAGQTAVGGYGYGGATGQLGANQQQVSPASQRSLEETVALYEINRAKNQQLIQSGVHLPPLPPHVLLRGQNLDGDSGANQAPAQSPVLEMPRPGMPQTMPQ